MPFCRATARQHFVCVSRGFRAQCLWSRRLAITTTYALTASNALQLQPDSEPKLRRRAGHFFFVSLLHAPYATRLDAISTTGFRLG